MVTAQFSEMKKMDSRLLKDFQEKICSVLVVSFLLSVFERVATAPTKQQLNDVLWAEVSKWQSNSPLFEDCFKMDEN